MKEILVVIPFWAQGAQGNELELALTGWKKHFKEPHKLVVVGDLPQTFDVSEYAEFIPCERIEPVPGQYLPHLDHVHKFRKVREAFPDTEGFVYTCDDIYPTADNTLADILIPKMPERGFPVTIGDWRQSRPDWYNDKWKTADLCRREGLPIRNWVCHLPVYYEWGRLLEIYDRYGCDRTSYIVENIYFNIKYPDNPQAVTERVYHDEVTTSSPCIRPMGSVMWVSNANSGWSRILEGMLREHYGLSKHS